MGGGVITASSPLMCAPSWRLLARDRESSTLATGIACRPKGYLMTRPAVIALALSTVVVSAVPAGASSSDAWAELWKQASAACVTASGLKDAKAAKPIDFSDKVLVVIDGRWPQPHMKNAATQFACLYDKRAKTAEATEVMR
jgi:hypothetical protein